jgi:pyridoxal phosphate enzyme (YggS family)
VDNRDQTIVSTIADNLKVVRDRICAAAASCGRSPEEITLLAVSKTFATTDIAEAIVHGQFHFGENRVQEAEGKIPNIPRLPGLTWHLIGHLQSNKARRAAQLFDVIHSIDSTKIASRISQACVELGKSLSVLIQVDLAAESTKSGAEAESISGIIAGILEMPAIRVDGLMIIPPYFDDPESARPYFRQLRALRDSLEGENPGCLGQQHLSMGMSHDFEVAIEEGATMVRVGTALFGTRPA